MCVCVLLQYWGLKHPCGMEGLSTADYPCLLHFCMRQDVTVEPRLDSGSGFSCVSFPGLGIVDMCPSAWFLQLVGILFLFFETGSL